MSGPSLDTVIHPPVRLQISGLLAAVEDLESAALRDRLSVSDSVLSKHLAALVEAAYVRLRKAAFGGRQRTSASLTPAGRRAFSAQVRALLALAPGAVDRAAE